MPHRLTLISDPTDEFPSNTNTSFKVRIPDGLRLDGQRWQIALLSLTLPNSDTKILPFASGTNNIVARTGWTTIHLKDFVNGAMTTIKSYEGSAEIKDTQVAGASNGVDYWNKMIQAHEAKVVEETYKKRQRVLDLKDDPAPVLFIKETMCPSFRWDGEDLIIKRRGTDSTNGSSSANKLYSHFDIAYEVALQWGLILVKNDGNVIPGPNLQMQLFEDLITPLYPPRKTELNLEGLISLNGSGLHADPNMDIPRGYDQVLRGTNRYDVIWYFTAVHGGKTEKLVRLSGHFEWRLTNLNATYDAIHKHVGKTIMVYSNLQQSNSVGSSNVQLLRQLVIPHGEDVGHTYMEPTHLEWLPASTQQTDIVEVQLADVEGNLLKLPKGKSLVTVVLSQTV